MLVKEALEKVKERKPNPYSDQMLLDWLNEIEAMVQTELMDKPPQAVKTFDLGELEEELLMPKPHDVCYISYVISMIEYNQQDYNAYNNTVILFNEQYDEAKRYYNNALSKNAIKVKNWMR